MENATPPNEFSFQKFFLRAWLINLIFTAAFAIILFYCHVRYENFTATRSIFLLNLGTLVIINVHSMLLLIFSVRRFIKKQILAGIIFFLHFLFSATILYYLYLFLAIFGWTCAMKS